MRSKPQIRLPSLFIYCVLILSILLVFMQVRDFDFITCDDHMYVYENPHVLKGLSLDGIIWAFTTGHAANWHPVTWLSLMLDVQVFGPDPGPLHLVNVFLHCANTLLLFAVLKKMTGALWPSAFVAAAFAIHPMHVESVAWISERKDVLSTFFLLLTVAVYAGYVKRPSVRRYIAALGFFVLGLMSKPMLVTLPFLLLLLDYWPLERFGPSPPLNRSTDPSTASADGHTTLYRLVIEKIPFFILAAVSSVVTFLVQRTGGAMTATDVIPLGSRLANALAAYAKYIGKLFWPEHLAVFYPLDISNSTPAGQLALYALLLAAITVLVLYLGRIRKYLPVGWFWFVGSLIPVVGLVQVGLQAYADRYTYSPYIGLFVMLAWGMSDLPAKGLYRKAVLAAAMVLAVAAMGITAHRYASRWRNGVTLFTHAIEVTQNNWFAYNNLGLSFLRRGRFPEAIGAFEQAVRLKPDDSGAYNNLGLAYAEQDCYPEAIEAYRQAVRLKPNNVEAYRNLGLAYFDLGRYEEAVEAYQQAVRIDPANAEAYNNLGLSCFQLGRLPQAITAYQQAIALKPDYAKAYANLAVAYNSLGRFPQALEASNKAVRIEPDYAEAYGNLGIAYSGLGRYPDAIQAFRQAITLKPDYANAYAGLAMAYGTMGRYTDAVTAFEQAVRLNPNDARSYCNLGAAYYSLGQSEQAIEAFKQAIALNPDYAQAHFALGLARLESGDKDAALKEVEILKILAPDLADKLLQMLNN